MLAVLLRLVDVQAGSVLVGHRPAGARPGQLEPACDVGSAAPA